MSGTLAIYRDRLKGDAPGLVIFVAAVAYYFYLALSAAFTQSGVHLLAEPCRCQTSYLAHS